MVNEIQVSNLGKNFLRNKIFENLSFCFSPGTYAVTGANGAGKSTFLMILAGIIPPSNGNITYSVDQEEIVSDKIYKDISFAAPYMEVVEEFSLPELLDFHFSYKQLRPSLTFQSFYDLIGIPLSQKDKLIRNYSSGMKQRLKIGLALFADTPFVFLDEPTSNLDREGIEWYKNNIQQKADSGILIISSNNPEEYETAEQIINIEEYHPST